ncbi:MAG: hypothetical protein HYV63_13790 [Candidatus Schekmanbacteria bacterium]|nr:hypothetical protein [Candidatus Schekmanbacteria bacterium]
MGRFLMRTQKAVYNFHVPLPQHLYEALRKEAQRSRESATRIAREGIEMLLKERRRRQIADEIRAFAEELAGTRFDLDPDLEEAAVERLLDERG